MPYFKQLKEGLKEESSEVAKTVESVKAIEKISQFLDSNSKKKKKWFWLFCCYNYKNSAISLGINGLGKNSWSLKTL